jgi:microcystin-dependent protein
MAEPYLAQITLYACNFAPRQWAMCQGQILSISQNTALFSLLGTYYGGNGTTTFGLPDLRGRVPLAYGQGAGLSNYAIGEVGGQPTVTLTGNEMARHNHAFNASTAVTTTGTSNGNTFGTAHVGSPVKGFTDALIYVQGNPNTTMNPQELQLTGGGGAHNNMQPYLTLNYCIAMAGIYPPRS